LAEKWEHEFIEPPSTQRTHRGITQLEAIDHLILLDLLGAPNPSIRSYFISTAWMFDSLIDIEHQLSELDLAHTERSFFLHRKGHQYNSYGIGDDHTPFISRGVSTLHIIAVPFPSVWHTLRVSNTIIILSVIP
jgi:glutaminyl-peptide cyclotransferase